MAPRTWRSLVKLGVSQWSKSATWSNIGCSPDSLDVLEAVDGVEPVASPQPRGEIGFTVLHISRNLKFKVLWRNLFSLKLLTEYIESSARLRKFKVTFYTCPRTTRHATHAHTCLHTLIIASVSLSQSLFSAPLPLFISVFTFKSIRKSRGIDVYLHP